MCRLADCYAVLSLTDTFAQAKQELTTHGMKAYL